ncbi:DUF817 domain-containing protein [Lacibacterium aquatile]|uniref:DUF817 domain-containing protein n=1 Tax=Lacibacterium aquatile TaxID=1168082 RepID=A0ABW5DYI6_9PROT
MTLLIISAARSPLGQFAREFLIFGLKQAWACLFGGAMLALIIATKLLWQPDWALHRYDFLFLAAFVLQGLLILAKLESWQEAKVIFLFHVVGTAMEVFKTAAGSWIYPEEAFFRLGGVPLFSGFMYACVGSYIARVTRLFDLRYSHYPPFWATVVLAVLIYINFFTHHYVVDIRIGLFAFAGVLYCRCWIYFTVDKVPRRMPLLLSTLLVAFFVWVGENVGTNSGTWAYAGQKAGWHLVSWGKLGSWFLLLFVSFVLVSLFHRPEPPNASPLAERG